MNRVFILFLCVCGIVAVPADLFQGGFGANKGSESTKAKDQGGTSEKKRTSYPFRGTVASVDSFGKTLTLEGKKQNRVIFVTGATRFFKNGAKAKLEDTAVGVAVSGTVQRNSSGQEEALTVRFGANPASKKKKGLGDTQAQ